MFNILTILLLISACATNNRTPADNGEFGPQVEYEVSYCLKNEYVKTHSILPEIFLVTSYDDKYYYLDKYEPNSGSRDFFENLTYDEPQKDWKKTSSLKMALRYVHNKFMRVSCPRNI